MIEKVLTQSRTTEVDAVAVRMTSAFTGSDLSRDTQLSGIFGRLATSSARLTAAINRARANSALDAGDADRDDKLRGLNLFVSGSLYHPDAAISAAARQLEGVMAKYGLAATVSASYATETSLINSLLGDLAAPELQASIEAIPGCAQNIAALHAAQTAFEQTYSDYIAQRASENLGENASEVKKEVVAIINNQVVQYLRAMADFDAEGYGALAEAIALIIAENNENVRRRTRTGESEPEPEGEP